MTLVHSYPDAERENDLVQMLASVTESVIEPIVRRKLHTSLRRDDDRRKNEDATDLVAEIQLALLAQLRNSHQGNGGIRDLHGYAATVAANACYQYFRSKYPVRTRLKNKLRYLLTHDPAFSVWKDAQEGWRCGFAEWDPERTTQTGNPSLAAVPPAESDTSESAEREVYLGLVRGALRRHKEPIVFDRLIDIVMEGCGLKENAEIAEGSAPDGSAVGERFVDSRPRVDSTVESRDHLERLWRGVLELPVRHRRALLLNLKDRRGERVITAFPLSGTVSIRSIAAALEFPVEEFAAIWNTLPWDDLRIAECLSMTRQQVINLRQSARAKLARIVGV